jgi:prepilin-type N-terminal cleavage/methylation domain-containing protein
MSVTNPDRNARGEAGFTLVEVIIATLVLTVGLVGMAQLLAVSTVMHLSARQTTDGTHLLQAKVEELAKLNFGTDPPVQIGGSLTANVANFNDAPAPGITRRWLVQAGPGGNPAIRRLTVRIINAGKRHQQADLTTVIRQW